MFLWLLWGWWQSLSLLHWCYSWQHGEVPQTLPRRKESLLTLFFFFNAKKLFLDATRLTHQPEFKSPTTGFSSFYFTASISFFRIKEEASAYVLEHILSVFPYCAECRLSKNKLLQFREDSSFFPCLSQDCVFQYLRILNKGVLHPPEVYFFVDIKNDHMICKLPTSFCLVCRLWQSLTHWKLSESLTFITMRDSHEMLCKHSKTGLHWAILWRPIFKVLLKWVWQQMILQACWIAIAVPCCHGQS